MDFKILWGKVQELYHHVFNYGDTIQSGAVSLACASAVNAAMTAGAGEAKITFNDDAERESFPQTLAKASRVHFVLGTQLIEMTATSKFGFPEQGFNAGAYQASFGALMMSYGTLYKVNACIYYADDGKYTVFCMMEHS